MADTLSDLERSEMIESFTGIVDSQFAKSSMMRQLTNVQLVRGTDTLINRRVGRTTLQALTPGVRPDSTQTQFGRVAVTVDTVVLARDNQSLLNSFQTDFSVREEIGIDQGKEHGKFFDQALIIQAMKGAALGAPANLNGAIGAGKLTTLTAANDENDPDKLYTAISNILTAMAEEEIDTSELVVLVRPTHYDVLLNNDKLINRDYSSSNGDYADGTFKTIKGAMVRETPRIPKAAITGHYLSNAENSNAYDVSATEARAVAVILHPKSLLVGETIPLTTDVWFNKEEKKWFIDSWISFGAGPRRPDVCGVVRHTV